jgi:hypothetical protein
MRIILKPFLFPFLLFLCVMTFAMLVRTEESARACGAFARARLPTETEAELAERLPFLTVEQVLLLWDKDTGIEDFIRETRFDRANQAFGFVVPTPTKPEVAAVKKAPFEALRKAYAFEPPRPPRSPEVRGGGGLSGAGAGGGSGAEPPPVVVLSEQRIGSFTAFTLATTDAGAFDKWLSDNGFAMTDEAKPWITRYIEQKFFFVALRYEPKSAGAAAGAGAGAGAGDGGAAPTAEMTSETIRIRFKTPHPYYPYMEPVLSKDAIAPYSRMLTGWLVTREPMNAVAYKEPTESEPRRFKRPWTTGLSFRVSTDDLAKVVGAELRPILPKTDPTLAGADAGRAQLVVQTFRDLKTRRTGFGDVVLVPATPASLSSEDEEARKFLLPVLDPTLLHEGTTTAAADGGGPSVASTPSAIGAAAAPSSTTPARRATGCSLSSSSSSSPSTAAWLIGALAVALTTRRRRRRHRRHRRRLPAFALAGLLACRPTNETAPIDGSIDKTTKSEAGGGLGSIPNTVAATPPREPTRDERIRAVYALLSGEEPDGGVVIDADQSLVNTPKGDAQLGESTPDVPIPNADRVIAGLRSRFRRCFQQGLTTDPSMSGKLVISAEIAPDGSVANAEVVTNTGLSPTVATCCTSTLRRAQFDPPAKTSKLKFPITFVQQQP